MPFRAAASAESHRLLLDAQGRYPEAEAEQRAAIALGREAWGDGSELAVLHGRLGLNLEAQGQEYVTKLYRALAQRAASGGEVSLILDWVGSSRMEESMLDEMRSAGVRIHRDGPGVRRRARAV